MPRRRSYKDTDFEKIFEEASSNGEDGLVKVSEAFVDNLNAYDKCKATTLAGMFEPLFWQIQCSWNEKYAKLYADESSFNLFATFTDATHWTLHEKEFLSDYDSFDTVMKVRVDSMARHLYDLKEPYVIEFFPDDVDHFIYESDLWNELPGDITFSGLRNYISATVIGKGKIVIEKFSSSGKTVCGFFWDDNDGFTLMPDITAIRKECRFFKCLSV